MSIPLIGEQYSECSLETPRQLQKILDVAFRTVNLESRETGEKHATELCDLVQKGYEIVSTAAMPGSIYYVLVLKEANNA